MTDAALAAIPIAASDELESPTRRALRRLLQRRGAVVGLVVIVSSSCSRSLRPLIAPYDPIATSWSLIRKPPSGALDRHRRERPRHLRPRGLRRARFAAGRRVSVGMRFGSAFPWAAGGLRGGFTDALISRIVDAMLACPFLILAIALAAFLGPTSATR